MRLPPEASNVKPAILVVDDNCENIVALEAILTDLECELVAVASGEQALEKVLRHDFALILMDVEMPGMSGLATARLIRSRERSSTTPIVFVTAHDQTDRRILSGYALGGVDFIFKPIVAEVLFAKASVFVDLFRRTELVRIQADQLIHSQRHELLVSQKTRELQQQQEALDRERAHAQELNILVQRLREANEEIRRREEDLRNTRDEALRLANVKSEFVATMSHEIRTPMNGIIGLAERLAETQLDVEQRDLLENIQLSAKTLMTLLNDVLDFSKLEVGQFRINKGAYSPRELLEQVLGQFAYQASASGLSFEAIIDPSVPRSLVGDERRVHQVLANFLGNALKFTQKGSVHLRAGTRRHHGAETLRIAVHDTGIGIATDQQHLLFEPFHQVDQSWARSYGGTGLGLSICRGLAEAMGGRVGVESELAHGSTFWLEVPMESPAFVTSPEELVGRKVLCVTHDDLQREALESPLTAWGMATTTTDPSEAAFRAATEDFDVVLASELAVRESRDLRAFFDSDTVVTRVLVAASPFGARGQVYSPDVRVIASPIRETHLRRAVTEEPPSSLHPDLSPPTPTNDVAPLRVLVAEDNPVNQMVVRGILQKLGHECTIVENGEEAVRVASSTHFDAVLMDCHMPVMDGYEAARRIAASERPAPILALTASALPEHAERCREAGMVGYLTKPITAAALADALATAPSEGSECSSTERHGQRARQGQRGGPVEPKP